MKWYNGLFSVKHWNDEEHEDYDSYMLGVQVEASNKEDAKVMMYQEISAFGRLETEYGISYTWEGFCQEEYFDVVGCDVL